MDRGTIGMMRISKSSVLIWLVVTAALVLGGRAAFGSRLPSEFSAFRELCVYVGIEANAEVRTKIPEGKRGFVDNEFTYSMEKFIRARLRDLELLQPVSSIQCLPRRAMKYSGQTTLAFHVTLSVRPTDSNAPLGAIIAHPTFEDEHPPPHVYPTNLFQCRSRRELKRCVDANLKAYFNEHLFPIIQLAHRSACPPRVARWRSNCNRERQPRYPD